MVTDYILLWTAGVLLVLYLIGQRKPKKFPPGPWGFPILGHLPLLGLEPYKTAMAWKSKYGPILGIDFASFPCIIISDYKMCKEAYAEHAFSGRPKVKFCSERSGGRPEGIIFADGRTWNEQRKFAHRRLREIGGFGTRAMESIILVQMHEFVEILTKKVGQDPTKVSVHYLFDVAVGNALWAIVAGQPFEQTNPLAIRAAKNVTEGFSDSGIFSMVAMFMPWLNDHFPDFVTGRKGVEKQYKPIIEFHAPYIEDHWRTHVPGQPRDLIDAWIDESKATTDPESSFHASRAKHSLATTILDLFLAGTETTATTLSWICLYMARYPEAQEKLVAEIRNVIGGAGGRSPSLADRKDMPYTEAVIHEVMRLRPLVPMSAFHSTTEPVHFHGYNIPKDTMVFINIWEAQHNVEYWGDPENFRPERWLNSAGNFERQDALIVFSTGKRVCLGEQLGRDEAFLFTTGMLQKFSIGMDSDSKPLTLDVKAGGTTLGPKEHLVVFTPRIKCRI